MNAGSFWAYSPKWGGIEQDGVRRAHGWGQNGTAYHGRSVHFFCFLFPIYSLLWTPAVPIPLQQLSCLSSRGVVEVPVLILRTFCSASVTRMEDAVLSLFSGSR